MLILHSYFYLELGTCSDIDLENEELVHHVEALSDSDSFRRRCIYPSVVKVSLKLSRVRRELNSLIIEDEVVSFNLRVEVFHDLWRALPHRERLLRLWSYQKFKIISLSNCGKIRVKRGGLTLGSQELETLLVH